MTAELCGGFVWAHFRTRPGMKGEHTCQPPSFHALTDTHCTDCNLVLCPKHPREVTRGPAGPACESPRMGF